MNGDVFNKEGIILPKEDNLEGLFADIKNKLLSTKNAKTAGDIVTIQHSAVLAIHAKALAAHCECLAMNAENCVRSCLNEVPAYRDSHYYDVLNKWGLINGDGKPLI